MKIGLLGYGKMGKAIDNIVSKEKDIEIIWRISSANIDSLTHSILEQADVVIEFSRPESAYDNVMRCLRANVPVVSGTTGWQQDIEKANQYCLENGGAFIWASNFSIGVNLFFEVNRQLSQLMSRRFEYSPNILEAHHIHKLDAPSGTAVTLAKDIIQDVERIESWILDTENNQLNRSQLPIKAIREVEIPGTHRVVWASEIDEIVLEHKAHSREGFASGAVVAARWIKGRSGVFTMQDVLGLKP